VAETKATGRGGGLTVPESGLLAGVVVLTVAAGVTRYLHGVSQTGAFVVAALALAGLAWLVSFATEEVGTRFGAPATGALQATLGNLPEFFVVLFALNAGQLVVAQTALLGSILVNALLVLGLVIIAGARQSRDGLMRFSARLPNDTATLLLSSTFIIALIALATLTNSPAGHHVKTISILGSALLLVVYTMWLGRYLRSDQRPAEGARKARLSTAAGVGLLVVAGAASGFVSDWFVHALTPTIRSAHISRAFAGLVIVSIAGNAVEHAVGIVLAAKGQADLAISVVKNSVAQIAAFLFPLLVLVSLATATTLTFSFSPIYVGALFGTAVIVWQVTGDGEATYFEGGALVVAFVILATVAWYGT
jgi:Ca2+:H+ antiporter